LNWEGIEGWIRGKQEGRCLWVSSEKRPFSEEWRGDGHLKEKEPNMRTPRVVSLQNSEGLAYPEVLRWQKDWHDEGPGTARFSGPWTELVLDKDVGSTSQVIKAGLTETSYYHFILTVIRNQWGFKNFSYENLKIHAKIEKYTNS
jgi:hypothetical protein